MTKEEILTEFGCPDIPFDENVTMYYPAILSAMEEYAQQAISDHEAGKWKKYPENDPTIEINCAVVCKGDREMDYDIWSLRLKQPGSNRKIWDEQIAMFYEIPAPFQEGRDK